MAGRTKCRSVAAMGFLLGLVSLPAVARAEIVERIVAVVNERVILLSELRMRFREQLPQLARIQDPKVREQQIAILQRQELEKLVDAILIEEEGKERKLEVTVAEVDKAIDTVLEQNKLTRAELISTLAQEGYSFAAYRADLRRQILRLKTINLAVRSRISVSWDEVRAAYQKSVAEMGVGLKLDCSQILLRVDPSASDGARLKAQLRRAERYARRLRAGSVTFADLARRISDDSATSAKGGRMGLVGRGVLPPRVEAAAFSAKGKEALVGPVVTDDGVYLVMVHDRKESEAMPFESVKNQLRERLYNVQAAKRTAAWVASLRRRAIIDIRL